MESEERVQGWTIVSFLGVFMMPQSIVEPMEGIVVGFKG
jgi:hypothetical protein